MACSLDGHATFIPTRVKKTRKQSQTQGPKVVIVFKTLNEQTHYKIQTIWLVGGHYAY